MCERIKDESTDDYIWFSYKLVDPSLFPGGPGNYFLFFI